MKNILKIILLLTVCSFSNAYAAEANSIVPTYEGNAVTLNVEGQGKAGDVLTITVVKKGAGVTLDNTFAIDEILVNAEGKAIFVYEMPEKIIDDNQQEVPTDGEYTLYVKNGNNDIKDYEFSFVTKLKRNAAVGDLSTGNAQQVEDMLKPESEYRQALAAVGIDFGIYDALSQGAKTAVAVDFTAEANTSENSIEKIKKIIAVKALNENSSDIKAIVQSINPEFEGEKYNDIESIEKQNFINSYLQNKKEQATVENINTLYSEANVIFIFNSLRFNEFEAKLDAYKGIIGISANEKYISYLAGTLAYRNKVGEELARILSNAPATDISSLVSAFERACMNAVSSTQVSVSGGGGASGGGSKTASATISTLQNNSYYDVFSDMKDAEWAKEAVISLYEKGIVSGVSENLFAPNKNVTREEFITMLVRAKKLAGVAVDIFDDVSADAWYAPYVGAAYNAGIVSGTSENSFGIGSLLTRQDMFTMIYRIIGQTGEKTRSIEEIQDFEQTSDYAKEAVKNLYESGCVSGTGEGKIEPISYTTRAQAAVMIYRLFAQGGTV